MKKNSKNLLKNTIRKIRNNQYRLPQLYEKLEYYEVKMIGYNSPSFEPRYSSSSPSHLSNLDYWLEKVWVVENQISKMEKEIKEFEEFVSSLGPLEQEIVKYLIDYIPIKTIITKHNISRTTYYFYIRKINGNLIAQMNINNNKIKL